MTAPKIIDDHKGEIAAVLGAETIKSWYYRGDRDVQRECENDAREFIAGWVSAAKAIAPVHDALIAAATAVFNYGAIDDWLNEDGNTTDVWGIRKEHLLSLRAAIKLAEGRNHVL